jgi:hypothetical protein
MLLSALAALAADGAFSPGERAADRLHDGLADLGTMELEMPAVEIRATPGGRSVWSTVPDGMAVEVVLAQQGIRPEDTSIIRVDSSSGNTRLDWSELGDGVLRLRVEKPGVRDMCTASVAGGIWAGGSDIVLYQPTPSGMDNRAADPGFLLVEGDSRVGALVSLSPGDAATVIDLRHGKKLIREVVQVSRASGTVRVERSYQSERICFVAPR